MTDLVRWRTSPVALYRLAVASVVSNVVIVVTGGAVRLTNSGLGCPTWPRCNGDSLTPQPRNAANGIIEFTNRSLTFVLVVVAVATLVAALSQHRATRLAVLAFLAIPAQAVLGGITVLTDLNPWAVACHFLLSMVILAITLRLVHAVDNRTLPEPAGDPVRWLAGLIAVVTFVVLMVGTVVTGSGPHAGDLKSGRIRRTGLDPGAVAHLHADIVMVLIGLTVGLIFLLRAIGSRGALARAASILLGMELVQGVIGFVQYFSHLPVLAVGLHMLGACLVWLAAVELTIRSIGRPYPGMISESPSDAVSYRQG
ncbi:MAG: COX15/CtaA family protein [Jatrophihabitans sp.]